MGGGDTQRPLEEDGGRSEGGKAEARPWESVLPRGAGPAALGTGEKGGGPGRRCIRDSAGQHDPPSVTHPVLAHPLPSLRRLRLRSPALWEEPDALQGSGTTLPFPLPWAHLLCWGESLLLSWPQVPNCPIRGWARNCLTGSEWSLH